MVLPNKTHQTNEINQINQMSQIVDLHTHILPGLDDGAKDWAESLKMCIFAQKEDISTIVCTPHIIPGTYDNTREKILLTTNELKEKLKKENITLQVVPGAEVYFSPEIIKRLDDNAALVTINDLGKFILLDFPTQWTPPFAKDLFFQLQLRGVTPIIAHPERSLKTLQNPDLIYEFVTQGALVQVSSSSIVGYLGKEVRGLCQKLIKCNLAHLVASDIHSPAEFLLQPSLKIVSDWIGKEKALKLFTHNPQRIVKGENIDSPEPERIKEDKFYRTKN